MLAQLEDFAAIDALALEHRAGIVQPVRQHVNLGFAPGDHFAIEPDEAVTLIEGLCRHNFLQRRA
jgi:hypothetical protein